MFGSKAFIDLISRPQPRAADKLLLGVLHLGEVCYGAVMRARNRRYDCRKAPVHRPRVPVISVGNITLGGAGKSPFVRRLARWFHERGVRVGIVSRGYGSTRNSACDETLEYQRLLPYIPHLCNADRAAAVAKAVVKHHCRLIVLDDGFQHRRLARDLDIVMLDALVPFGFGHVFPRGLLREPLEGLRRADVVVLSRADLITPTEREAIRNTVRMFAPDSLWVEAAHVPSTLFTSDNLQVPLGWVLGRRVAAFCGIGNPSAFRHTLEKCNCCVVDFRSFPDHHRFTPGDLKQLTGWASSLDVEVVLCTLKDLVKLNIVRLADKPLLALGVEIEILAGEEALAARLEQLRLAALENK